MPGGEDPLSPDVVLVTGKTASPGQAVKYAVAGFAAGVFLAACLLAAYYILFGIILSAEELNSRYGLRTLTVLPKSGLKGLSLKLARMGCDGTYYGMSPAEQLEVAAVNTSVYAPEARDILLVGDVDSRRLAEVAEALSEHMEGVQVTCAPNINENAASLQALKAYDYVILVEQLLTSRYARIDHTIQRLMDYNKTIIGTVVVG